MSRSTRRPYAAITGTDSAKDDKRLANRGVRRAQNHALRTAQDYENLILPHRLECAWNDVWVWSRDGGKSLHFPPSREKHAHWHWATPDMLEKWYQQDLRYYRSLLRK